MTAKKRKSTLLIEGKVERPSPKGRRRPKAGDNEAFASLCDHIAKGLSLRSWAEQNGYDDGATVHWVRNGGPDWGEQYREARRMQADAHIDQLIELSDSPVPCDADGRTDSGAVQQLRVRIDTRKWVAAKFYPALYGDRVAVDANVTDGTKERPTDIMAKITTLLGAHGLRITADSDGTGEGR